MTSFGAGFHCLSLAVVDRTWRLSRRLALWLLAEPALVLAALATNPWHHWFMGWSEGRGSRTNSAIHDKATASSRSIQCPFSSWIIA